MKLILDAHLDLSLNAIEWNRDLRRNVEEIRRAEQVVDSHLAGHAAGVVSLPEMRRGGIGVCVATQIGGCMKPRSFVANWESPSQAWAMTQAQLAWYREMEEQGEMRQIRDRAALQDHLKSWAAPAKAASENLPVGFILSLEGADSIVTLDHLGRAWENGLRALGPSHYGTGRYAMGHDASGGLPDRGKQLLRAMDELGIILDVTHLNDECFWQAVEIYEGTLWASHQNCRALVNDPRQFSDEQIRLLIERDSVLGVALDVWMVVPGFVRGVSHPADLSITLENIADQIDHICQLAGNARHCGIGTDLDGGYGNEQCPCDVDTIADLQKLEAILTRRGYEDRDISRIFHGNFLRVLETGLPRG